MKLKKLWREKETDIEKEKELIYFLKNIGLKFQQKKSLETALIEALKENKAIKVNGKTLQALITGKSTVKEILNILKEKFKSYRIFTQLLGLIELHRLDTEYIGKRLVFTCEQIIPFLDLKKEREEIFTSKRLQFRFLNGIYSFTLGGLTTLYTAFTLLPNGAVSFFEKQINKKLLVIEITILLIIQSVLGSKIVKDNLAFIPLYVLIFLLSLKYFWLLFI